MINHFNNENFKDEVLNSDVPVLVDFWATWCGPCQMQGPIFESVAEEYGDVVFGKVNIDENPEIAAKYLVRSIPTMILFKDGEAAATAIGLQDEDELRELIDENK